MYLPPFMYLIVPTLITSTALSISASSWIMMWLFLEVNMFVFLPLMGPLHTTLSAETMIKYFMIQSMTSTVILVVAYLTLYQPSLNLKILFLIAIMTKLGAAPCHSWLLMITKHMPWLPLFLALTWQKIPSLALTTTSPPPQSALSALSVTGALVGVCGAVSQTQIRPLLTFSSISHTGWILLTITHSQFLFLTYTTTYFTMLLMTMSCLAHLNTLTHWAITPQTSPPLKISNLTIMNLLSLSNLPPLLGFSLKWLSLFHLTPMIMITSILLITSAVSLLYYIMIVIMFGARAPKTITNPQSPFLRLQLMANLLGPIVLILS